MQLHRHCYQKKVEVAGGEEEISLFTPAYDDDIRTSMGISIPFLGRLCHRALFNTRRLNAGRVPESPAESQISMKTFTAYCTMQCHPQDF